MQSIPYQCDWALAKADFELFFLSVEKESENGIQSSQM